MGVMNCDGYDPSPPEDGYCTHGTYVGGCGWDLMCFYCEMGYTAEDLAWERLFSNLGKFAKAAEQRENFDGLVAVLQGSVPQRGWDPGIAHWLTEALDRQNCYRNAPWREAILIHNLDPAVFY